MSSAIWEVQLGIVSMLMAHSSLEPTLGNPMRIYDQPPQDPVFPYLTFGPSQSRFIDAQDAPAQEHEFTLHMWSRYRGRREVREFIGFLASAIESGTPVMTDFRMVSVRPLFIDVFRMSDGLTTHGVLRLKAVTEPALLPA